jgi:hypothetical protein
MQQNSLDSAAVVQVNKGTAGKFCVDRPAREGLYAARRGLSIPSISDEIKKLSVLKLGGRTRFVNQIPQVHPGTSKPAACSRQA